MNHLLISLVSMALVCVLALAALFVKTAKSEDKLIPYLIILIFVVLTYIYKIGEYPWGLHLDEAGAMYDGINIAKYGYDRYMNPFPVYFINYGGGQNALFTYVFAGWYKLLSLFVNIDLSIININTALFILRFPTLLYNLIAYLISFLVIRKEYGNKPALIGLIVFMATPFGLMHSRFSLESYYLFPTLLIAISLFIKGIKNHNSVVYAFSGLFFGLTLYTYAISYLIVPLLLIVLLVIIIYTKNFNIINCISFILPLLFISIPIFLFFVVNYFDIPQLEYLGMTITKLPMFRISDISLTNMKTNLLNFELFKRTLYDFLDYNSYKSFSTILYLNIPMFMLGLVESIKRLVLKTKLKVFCIDSIIITTLAIIVICESLVLDLNVNKLNAIYIPVLFYVANGYLFIMKKTKFIFRIIILILITNYSIFVNVYYSRNQRMDWSKPNELMEQIQLSNKLCNEKTIIYYEIEYGMDGIYVAIFNELTPNEFKNYSNKYREVIPNQHDVNDIYIIDDCFDDNQIFEKEGYKLVKNGRYNLYYK